jgi:RND family efflux transporter MFP subunit
VFPASVQDLTTPFEAGGVIRARTAASLVSRIVAEVREVRVQPGDRVKRGQVLVTLDDRDLMAARSRAQAAVVAASEGAVAAQAARESADAALALARATHERINQLRARNSATPQELDRATADLRAADAGVRAAVARVSESTAAVEVARAAGRVAEVNASFAHLTAPFDGLVTSKLIEPGNMASPGIPLVTLDEVGGFRLEVRMDEARAALINVGADVQVETDSGFYEHADAQKPPALAGRVVEMARTVDAGPHSFVVKVDLPADAPVRSGMFGRARFAGPTRQGLAVPASSVVHQGQLTLVFVVDAQDRARIRPVSLGVSTSGIVEVLAGLKAGELVIADPRPSIVDGTPIRRLPGQGDLR